MNKKLLALAVAGACIAPTAMAQTANPVTLYGRIYVMVESVKAQGLPTRTRVTDGSSLIGVRGTEDLGGGLKAFFQLETAFETGNSAGNTYATRNSGVGLQGGWGSLMAGRWDSPYKSATIAIDPFGDLTIAGITSALNDRGNHDRRTQNVIQYWSPAMGGFAFRLSHGVNEGKTATLNPNETAMSITYRKAPVYAFLTYEELKDIGAFAKQEARRRRRGEIRRRRGRRPVPGVQEDEPDDREGVHGQRRLYGRQAPVHRAIPERQGRRRQRRSPAGLRCQVRWLPVQLLEAYLLHRALHGH